eukprot:scaffold3540_cov379-Prasinococcus_capsulatus_cf.AAC.14
MSKSSIAGGGRSCAASLSNEVCPQSSAQSSPTACAKGRMACSHTCTASSRVGSTTMARRRLTWRAESDCSKGRV